MTAKAYLQAGICVLFLGAGQAPGALAQGQVVPMPADAAPVSALASSPSVTISNGLVTAKIYVPDRAKGFYRGTRFDWAGVVGSLTYKGQEYYGPWFDKTAADMHDYVYAGDSVIGGPDSATSGPVEEFNTQGRALGFDEAAPGGTFIKIGVGILKRPDSAPYDHYRHYEIADGGKRDMHATKDSITFSQDVNDFTSGYAYSYVKTLRLVPGKPQMIIEHHFRNLSNRPLATNIYDHNFLVMSPGNADMQIVLPFAVKASAAPPAGLVRIEGNTISYLRALAGTEKVAFSILGFGPTAKDYNVRILNRRTGFGMAVRGDQALASMNLFSIRTTLAVEPHFEIALPPGGAKDWTYTYDYFGPGDK